MLKVLRSWFTSKPRQPTIIARIPSEKLFNSHSSDSVKPGEYNIGYDSRRIDILKSDHRDLANMIASIRKSVNEQRYETIPTKLEAFKKKFIIHSTNKNLYLYRYLLRITQKNPDLNALHNEIKNIHSEMNYVSSQVKKFCKQWLNTEVDDTNDMDFISDIKRIYSIMLEHMQREENGLFKVYSDFNSVESL
ncbi:MAG: hemerythrin domain-containing protein [Pseudomonadota bacterium]